MRMRNLNSFLALAFALGLTTVGCMRESSRIGEGDVATNAFTNQNSKNSTPPSQAGPAADNTGESIDTSRAPASEKPSDWEARDAAIPHDEKGIVGSPYASNINRSTEGQPQVGEKSGLPSGNPNAQPSVPAGKIGGEPIDIRQYPFARKDDFKSTMGARLQAVDQAIGAMKETQGASPQASAKFQALEKQADRLEGQLKTVDSVPAQSWDSFKSKFRDQVVSLETSYNEAITATR